MVTVRGLLAGLAAVGLVGVAACSSPSSPGGGGGGGDGSFDTKFADLIAAAKAEGSLTWYESLSADGANAYAQQFEQRFGVKVQIVFNSLGPLQQRFESELHAGQAGADVISFADPAAMIAVMNAGETQPYTIAEDSAYPDGFVLHVNNSTAYPTTRVQMAVAYNTELVDASTAAGLSSWQGLLAPSLKGQLGLADANKVGSYYSTAYLWNTDNRFGDSFLSALGAQNPTIYGGQTEEGQRLAAGEIAVGVMVDQIAILNYNNGSPVAWTYPAPTPQTLEYSAIVSTAPHPNAAKLFMEYTHDKEGALVWGKDWGGYLGRPDLDADLNYPFAQEPWYKAPTENFVIPTDATDPTTKTTILQNVTNHLN